MKKNFIILFAMIFATCIFCAKANAQTYAMGLNFKKIDSAKIEVSAQNWKDHFTATDNGDGTWNIQEEIGGYIFSHNDCKFEKIGNKYIFIWEDSSDKRTWIIGEKYLTLKMQKKMEE